MSVQTSFSTYPATQYVGTIAHPSEPFAVDTGLVYVTGSDRKPRPGDTVYYDTANNGFRVAASAANLRAAVGICVYGPGEVPNDSGVVEFDNDAEIWVCTLGVVWVTAGGSIDYGTRVIQDTHSSPDWKYDADNFNTSVNSVSGLRDELYRTSLRCVSFDIADGHSMKVRVSTGGAG